MLKTTVSDTRLYKYRDCQAKEEENPDSITDGPQTLTLDEVSSLLQGGSSFLLS